MQQILPRRGGDLRSGENTTRPLLLRRTSHNVHEADGRKYIEMTTEPRPNSVFLSESNQTKKSPCARAQSDPEDAHRQKNKPKNQNPWSRNSLTAQTPIFLKCLYCQAIWRAFFSIFPTPCTTSQIQPCAHLQNVT